MSFALLREILGAEAWCVDQHTYPALSAIMQQIRNGISIELPDTKYNSPEVLRISNDTRLISQPYQLNNTDNFKGIGIINIDGPITVSGGTSSYGMDYVSDMMYRMSNDSRIQSFIIRANSGGGSSSAVEIMTDTINEIKKTKPVYGHIKEGGMAASAMYGILSACTEIYAAYEMSIVGSVGTMIEFQGKKANTTDNNGVITVRMYAPGSTEKNKWYEEALNNANYEVLVDELLRPINERFTQLVLNNRPALKGTNYDDGHTVFAKDGIGTFIDGIRTFSQVVEIASQNVFTTSGSNSNINPNSKKMTVQELQANHPETYNSIFNLGVNAEKDRVGSWLAHHATNPEKVVNGIKGTDGISATVREELLVEANSRKGLAELESDSAKPIVTKESASAHSGDDVANKDEVDNFYAQVDAKLKTA